MRYLIIGLGIYGTNLAKDLTDMGNEVIGADINATIVAAIKDYISTAYIIDSTDESAIGEQFGASIKTVALLRKLGVRKIYARAIDDLHSAILEGMHVERILNPEQSAARDLSDEMALGTHVDSLRVDRDTYVMRFAAPDYFKGMAYIDLTQEAMFGLRLVAASRPRKATNILGLDSTQLQPVDISNPSAECVQEGDVLTCVGSMKAYKSLGEHIGPS